MGGPVQIIVSGEERSLHGVDENPRIDGHQLVPVGLQVGLDIDSERPANR